MTALHDYPLHDYPLHDLPSSEPADPAIFETLPIKQAAPFGRPPLRLVVEQHHEGGRRVAPAARRAPAPLRLTRRGRVVSMVAVVLLALVVSVVMFVVGVLPSSASPAPVRPAGGAATVTVQPGDTLWSIASRVAPKADPRVTVQQIVDRNGLAGASIEAGQVLVLPS